MKFSTPIALLIFNRPQLTQKVFEVIAKVQPQKLLVIADGPRSIEEAEKCQQARAVIEQVDWDCDILTNFSEYNLGCKDRVASGIDWVFSQVEEAIILEDDCIADLSFFPFCQTLLERYRDDQRVMHIGGNNFQFGQNRTPYSYYFSLYCHIWGWASWRRAWKYYDVEMKTWTEYKNANLITSVFEHPEERKYWLDRFEEAFTGTINTWDYQWTYACWSQQGLSITPNVNLVTNIGFGSEATHTKSDGSGVSNLPTGQIYTMNHPPFMTVNREADIFTTWRIFLNKEVESIYHKIELLEQEIHQKEQILHRQIEAHKEVIKSQEITIKQQIETIEKLERERTTAKEFLVAMESSKFWKLRQKWFEIKTKLKLSSEQEVINFSEQLQ